MSFGALTAQFLNLVGDPVQKQKNNMSKENFIIINHEDIGKNMICNFKIIDTIFNYMMTIIYSIIIIIMYNSFDNFGLVLWINTILAFAIALILSYMNKNAKVTFMNLVYPKLNISEPRYKTEVYCFTMPALYGLIVDAYSYFYAKSGNINVSITIFVLLILSMVLPPLNLIGINKCKKSIHGYGICSKVSIITAENNKPEIIDILKYGLAIDEDGKLYVFDRRDNFDTKSEYQLSSTTQLIIKYKDKNNKETKVEIGKNYKDFIHTKK